MESKLPAPTPHSGQERLTHGGQAAAFTLLDFWRWCMSDILSNATRGVLAEFIVATATGFDRSSVREEWGLYDLTTPEGIKIEVKSAAYIQTWHKADDKHSAITFGIKETADFTTPVGERMPGKKRWADVYVFCLLHHTDRASIDPLNLDQWTFYVLATQELNAYNQSAQSISLKALQRLTAAVGYDGLAAAIRAKSRLNSTDESKQP